MYADAHRDLLVDGATAAEDDGTAASDTARQPPSLPRVLAVFRNPAEQVCGRLTRKGQVRGGGACVDAIAELPHPPPPLPPAASAEERARRLQQLTAGGGAGLDASGKKGKAKKAAKAKAEKKGQLSELRRMASAKSTLVLE